MNDKRDDKSAGNEAYREIWPYYTGSSEDRNYQNEEDDCVNIGIKIAEPEER